MLEGVLGGGPASGSMLFSLGANLGGFGLLRNGGKHIFDIVCQAGVFPAIYPNSAEMNVVERNDIATSALPPQGPTLGRLAASRRARKGWAGPLGSSRQSSCALLVLLLQLL